MEDVARVQGTLDVVDLRLGKALPAPPRVAPKLVAMVGFFVSVLAGQTGIILVPIFIGLWKPAPAAFAAIGAMSIVRAILGWLEGSSGFDEDIARLGLVAMVVLGVVAIVLAVRLVQAGRGTDHLRLTIRVLGALAAAMALVTAWEVAKLPAGSIVGAPIFGTLGTALAGVAAALFTARTRRSRQAAFAGLIGAAAVAETLSVDPSTLTLRDALAEGTAKATLLTQSDLGGAAQGLRVSPNGTYFLASRAPAVRRAATRSRRRRFSRGAWVARPASCPRYPATSWTTSGCCCSMRSSAASRSDWSGSMAPVHPSGRTRSPISSWWIRA